MASYICPFSRTKPAPPAPRGIQYRSMLVPEGSGAKRRLGIHEPSLRPALGSTDRTVPSTNTPVVHSPSSARRERLSAGKRPTPRLLDGVGQFMSAGSSRHPGGIIYRMNLRLISIPFAASFPITGRPRARQLQRQLWFDEPCQLGAQAASTTSTASHLRCRY